MSGLYYKDDKGGQYFVGTSDRGWTFFHRPKAGRPVRYGAKPWANKEEAMTRLKEFARLHKLTQIDRLEI